MAAVAHEGPNERLSTRLATAMTGNRYGPGFFSGKRVQFSEFATVLDLIVQTTQQHPARIAVVYRSTSLTYQQLMNSANTVGRQLQELGVRPRQRVALAIGNSLSLPVAMVGAMRAGAVFVPVDAGWSSERLSRCLMEMDARALLIDPAIPLMAAVPVVGVEADVAMPEAPCNPVPTSSHDPAYAYYTSGSSGTPKLAVNLHGGLLNRFLHMTSRFGDSAGDVVLQNSRPVFDSCLWQLLWPLTTGSRVVVPDRQSALDFDRTLDLVARHRVTMTDFVPSVFNVFVDHLCADTRRLADIRSLRHLLVGGEEMNGQQVQVFKRLAPHVSVTNTYGPTEASIGMIFHEVTASDGDVIPLGRPIPNTFAVVLRADVEVAAAGEVGELYIGGECLGSGYLGDEEATARAFVPNPIPQMPWPLLYRTGDRAYQDQAGVFHWVGRVDRQVKVNGVRLDVSDIERALLRHAGVAQAAVIIEKERHGGSFLTACVVTRPGTSIGHVRSHAKQSLPREAVPRRFVDLDALPHTPNGKVDRRALGRVAAFTPSEAPSGPRDLALDAEGVAALFAATLEVAEYHVDEDFFAAGGDSLLAVVLVDRLESTYSRSLSLLEVYEQPTPSGLLKVLCARPPGVSGAQPAPVRRGRTDSAARAERDCHLADEVAFAGTATGPLRNVLVTGATGFLGAHIASTMVRRTEALVVCLVRAGDVGAARRRLREAWSRYEVWEPAFGDRVIPLPGDLREPRFGVEHDRYGELCDSVDTVVHCGAVVDLLHGYEHHRLTNVYGTAEVIRFCAEKRTKVLHHLSTVSVIPLRVGDSEPGTGQSDQRAPTPPRGGYGESKWVGERLIERARSRGLPAAVYRLGEVMPHSTSGAPNVSSAFVHFASACAYLGAYPRLAGRSDYFPVDWVSDILVANAVARHSPAAPLHLVHPDGVSFDVLGAALAAADRSMRAVTVDDWLARLLVARDTDASAAVRSLRALLGVTRSSVLRPDEAAARLQALVGSWGQVSQVESVAPLPPGWHRLPAITETLLRPFARRLTATAPSCQRPMGRASDMSLTSGDREP